MNMQNDITTIGPYKLLRSIGSGGMAQLYYAEKKEAEGLTKHVAVKRIHKEFAGDKRFSECFIQEARLSLDLQHPNIVQVYGFEKIEGELLLVMEYVDGVSLASFKDRPLSPQSVWEIIAQILDGLTYLHFKGIVHNDISPQNILIDTNGHVRLTDFGISLLADEEKKSDFGNLRYASQSIISGNPPQAADDLYSLGLILAELLSGSNLPECKGLDCETRDKSLKRILAGIKTNGFEQATAFIESATDKNKSPELEHLKALAPPSSTETRTQLGSAVVNIQKINAFDANCTRDLPQERASGKQTGKEFAIRWAKRILLLAILGFIAAQILTAAFLRTTGEGQEEPPAPSEATTHEIKQIEIGLVPIDARPKATLYIDAQKTGTTPLRLKLKPGTHKAVFEFNSKDGKTSTIEKTFQVHPGANKEIYVKR